MHKVEVVEQRLLAFAYHALRSAYWRVRAYLYDFGLWCMPYNRNFWLGGGYSEGLSRVAWQSARRAMGWEVRC